MELPRISRVGELLVEHRRIALAASIMIPLGALATKILHTREGVQEQVQRNQAAGNEANQLGQAWHILTEDDLA